jgi:HPt (histidine-containing phosphotransfer) domain-containing protein
MSDQSSTGPAERLQHDADELEDRLERLGDHLEEAEELAAERRRELEATEAVAGDWRDTKPSPAGGDDPKGAIDG